MESSKCYHNHEQESIKIFPSQRLARKHRKPDETIVPIYSGDWVVRWGIMPTIDYIRAKYSIRKPIDNTNACLLL